MMQVGFRPAFSFRVPENFRRLFTREEAEGMLDSIRPLVARMVAARDRILSLRPALQPVMDRAQRNGGSRKAAELLTALEEIRASIEAVQTQGILVKDVNTGLLDFPSQREDRVVFLCWQFLEEHVAFWHEQDTGFSGRKPL